MCVCYINVNARVGFLIDDELFDLSAKSKSLDRNAVKNVAIRSKLFLLLHLRMRMYVRVRTYRLSLEYVRNVFVLFLNDGVNI